MDWSSYVSHCRQEGWRQGQDCCQKGEQDLQKGERVCPNSALILLSRTTVLPARNPALPAATCVDNAARSERRPRRPVVHSERLVSIDPTPVSHTFVLQPESRREERDVLPRRPRERFFQEFSSAIYLSNPDPKEHQEGWFSSQKTCEESEEHRPQGCSLALFGFSAMRRFVASSALSARRVPARSERASSATADSRFFLLSSFFRLILALGSQGGSRRKKARQANPP